MIDLHCDLLGCIAMNPALSFTSREVRCSLPDLEAGGVTRQVLAISALSDDHSATLGQAQLTLFETLQRAYPAWKERFILAVENASALLDATAPIEAIEARLKAIHPLYVSLTWNGENRFGGGNETDVGLKEDGKRLLCYMDRQGTAIDLSHTSDRLAGDILNFIDKANLTLPVMASHSNLRRIKDVPRNLPDELFSEIVRRGGLVGLNFVRRFVGEAPEDLICHLEHGLALNGLSTWATGADFFGGIDEHLSPAPHAFFFSGFDSSACYPRFKSLITKYLGKDFCDKLCFGNARVLLEKHLNPCPEQEWI